MRMAKYSQGTPAVTLTTFDQSGQVTIDLDVRFDGRGNAKKCFQKYNKGKKGQEHLLEQIDLCEKEIEYFEGLEQQLELANFEDAREIREELAALGYMKPIQSKIRRNRKKGEGPAGDHGDPSGKRRHVIFRQE